MTTKSKKQTNVQDKSIIVTCMDRRITGVLSEDISKHPELKDIFGDNPILVRNAGGSIESAKGTIKDLLDTGEFATLGVVVHTDCGAMGVVYSVCKGERASEQSEIDALEIADFKKFNFNAVSELCRLNEELQRSKAESIFGADKKIAVRAALLDVNKLNVPKGDGTKYLVITTPGSPSKYSKILKGAEERWFSYIIQANDIEEMLPSIRIAVKDIGVQGIRLIATTAEESHKLNKWADKIRQSKIANGLPIVTVLRSGTKAA